MGVVVSSKAKLESEERDTYYGFRCASLNIGFENVPNGTGVNQQSPSMIWTTAECWGTNIKKIT